jgi:hypothetical protein
MRAERTGQTSRETSGEIAKVYPPSLRANGSRECAPDDKLREAIHGEAKRKLDCFAALAMTVLKYVLLFDI